MKVVGLTGGVGCGKSAVANLLKEEFNARLLITDEIAHLVYEKDTDTYQTLVKHFGEDILDSERNIDRGILAKRIFSDESELTYINQIVHPFVKEYIQNEIVKYAKAEGILILESAILFESGLDVFCDEIWYVKASEQTRRERLKQSRGYSEEKIDSIMKKQLSPEEMEKRCSHIISNDSTLQEVRSQLELILES